ncbi:MAG: biotin transporter BioY [Eubacteriaceae bacterium]|jgi:biotin transport system substrate-specific component|nr:biotin transporter BioY [Eubacteriaceae bacterium]MDD4508378.1 biotin transporter BioY [Eubacteriaceae bacterium]
MTTVNEKTKTSRMVRVAMVTAVICILGPLSIPIPISPVPISLTQLGIYLAIYALDKKGATLATLLYLLIGAVGLPVFSGFGGGIGKLAGPTGGYLIGFVFLAVIGSLAVDRYPDSRLKTAVGFVLGNLVIYLFGSVWLSVVAGVSFLQALAVGVVPYILFDVAKMLLALGIGPKIRQLAKRY